MYCVQSKKTKLREKKYNTVDIGGNECDRTSAV